jgi:two-component system chemotaxis response regulator CheV
MASSINYDEQTERQEILLETGTNEVEILEFILRDQSFGVNVAKIKQIVQYEPGKRNEVPESPSAMMGVYLHRDGTIPLIDLGQALHMDADDSVEKPLVLVCEFNNVICGFYIDGVKRIHRLSWKDIQPMNEMLAKRSSCIISSVNIDSEEVLIVDLEHIIAMMGISDNSQPTEHISDEIVASDFEVRIILAEDSGFIRSQMVEFLRAGGFTNIEAFPSGQKAYDAIQKHIQESEKEKRPITDYFNFIITDIEMPQMDGLTLCRLIKEDPRLKKVPVTIYSSLINDQMQIKCKQVGADYHMCKPQLGDLMKMINKHLAAGGQ